MENRLKSTWKTRRAPSCSSMPAICCPEEGGLALSIRTLAGLAQVQEFRGARRKAGGRGGLTAVTRNYTGEALTRP